MKLRVYLSIILIHAVPILGFSQQNLKFDHISVEDGLSNSNVISIYQDHKGFMWFCTRDGLNKFDGYKFTVYKNNEKNKFSLSQNAVYDITRDSQNNLWVATRGGLNKFNQKTEQFIQYQHHSNDPNSLSSDMVNSVLEDSKGHLWVGTDGGGLDLFDRNTNKFKHYGNIEEGSVNNKNKNIKDIFEDSKQNLWIGTDAGLFLYDQTKDKFISIRPPSKGAYKGHFVVTNIFEDSKQRCWIGTSGGIALLDFAAAKFRHFYPHFNPADSAQSPVILSINEDDGGNIWIGTENDGLKVFDPQTEKFTSYLQDDNDQTSLSNNSIYSIYKDTKGNMWVGTFSGGLNMVNKDCNKFNHYNHTSKPNSLNNRNVLAIFEDSEENMWIGTDGGGLNLFNKKDGTFTHFMHDPTNPNSICGNYILEIAEDSKGNLWIGTWGNGISVYNRKKKTFKHYKTDSKDPTSLCGDNAWTIFMDSDKQIWIGTYSEGMDLYDPETESFIHFKYDPSNPNTLSGNVIHSIFEDSKHNLWIGTNGSGLNLYDKKNKKFTRFVHDNNKHSISNNSIGSIREDKVGNLWIGTEKGLNYLNTKTHDLTIYTIEDGLPNNVIYGILEDDKSNLWISTNKGISKFNPKTKVFKNYKVADGLQSDEFKAHAYFKSKSGLMYFGGINGFNEFHPDSIKDKPFEPPIVFTNFLIFNRQVPISVGHNKTPLLKSISETDVLTLSYKESVIELEFALLNYTSIEKKQYTYKLEGFDNDWYELSTRNKANYTNLDPGTYILRVRGLNNEGEFSKNTASMKIIITPPYWRTWWFKTLYGLLAMGIILGIFKIRVNVVENQKRALESQVTERTKQLAHSTQEERYAREEAEKARQEAEKARHEAELANKAKSIFLATMSHEIRTPMNGVIGMAALLSETTQSNEQKEYTETIQNCGENLLGVINDILDFSKIESGHMEMESADFDLRTCIEEVLDVFSGKAAKIGLDLIYGIDQNVPLQIVGDSLRLRQVIMNLVSNAIKFTQQGEVFVVVHLVRIDGNDITLGFEIRDTGIGISNDKIDRLFKAFSQVDSSMTRKYGGTGLGLVICEKLIGLMGGTIEVESRIDIGTTFKFTIQTSISQHPEPMYLRLNLDGLEGKRVLVVDDNATYRGILKNQLEQWKLVPVLASSGKDALSVLSRDANFDLILTDMKMPEMDSMQLVRSIRVIHSTTPIILLSSVGDEKLKENELRFYSLLNKPVRQSSLQKHILLHLKGANNTMHVEDDRKINMSTDFAAKFPMDILIVEDNLVNQKLAERVLVKLGYKPDLATNGLEALKVLEQRKYNVILMDVQMPVMDGLETTKRIRSKPGVKSIIIAMTANAMQGDREECLQAGMDDYISKPIRLEILIDVLEKWAMLDKVKLQ